MKTTAMALQCGVWPCPSEISRYLLYSGVEQIAETVFGVRRKCVGARQICLTGSKRPARTHQGVASALWWSVYHQLESTAVSSASGPHSSCGRDTEREREHMHAKYIALQWFVPCFVFFVCSLTGLLIRNVPTECRIRNVAEARER